MLFFSNTYENYIEKKHLYSLMEKLSYLIDYAESLLIEPENGLRKKPLYSLMEKFSDLIYYAESLLIEPEPLDEYYDVVFGEDLIVNNQVNNIF